MHDTVVSIMSSSPFDKKCQDVTTKGNEHDDGEEESNKPSRRRRQVSTTLSDNQEASTKKKRAKKRPEDAHWKASSSHSSVSDSPSAQSSQQLSLQWVPQDQMHKFVAQLMRMQQQQAGASDNPSSQSQSMAQALTVARLLQQGSIDANANISGSGNSDVFNNFLGGQNVRGGVNSTDVDLMSLALRQHQNLRSPMPLIAEPPVNAQNAQQQQRKEHNTNESIMATLTQILQQHHGQQRQDLLQQQQHEMQTLHQIQNSSDQQQHLMLLLQLFVRQQQNQGSQSSTQTINAPSPQFVQGILHEFMQNNSNSAASSQVNPMSMNNSDDYGGGTQDASQLQLLQLLIAQQLSQGQKKFSMYSHVGNREDSHAQGSSLPSSPDELLNLMVQQWNQMLNNSASLVSSQSSSATMTSGTASGATTLPTSHDRNTSDPSTAAATSSSRGDYAMVPATAGASAASASMNQTIYSPKDAAQIMQQKLLMDAFNAASNNMPDEIPPAASGTFTMEDLKYAFPDNAFSNRDSNGRASSLPSLLVMQDDQNQLSAYQSLLRYQIEVFRATETDASTHQRGRNKPIRVNQIGVRCRHCSHLPISKRSRGSSYFPSGVAGVYEAGQNMNSTHFQQ